MTNDYLHMLENLALVLSVIFMLLYFLKKMKASRISTPQHVKIIQTIALGPKEKIILLKVDDLTLLLGVTPSQITKLHTVSQAPVFTPAPVLQTQGASFAETFSALN